MITFILLLLLLFIFNKNSLFHLYKNKLCGHYLWYCNQSNDNIGIKIQKGDYTSHKISLFGVFRGYYFYIYGVIIKKMTL